MAVEPFSTIEQLGRALRAKEISAVALAGMYLDRLERYGQTTRALASIRRDEATRDAEAADLLLASGDTRNQPLLGIPYGVNDFLDADATVVERLRKAGAVLVARLAFGELKRAAGQQTREALCGSSAAIASGLVPFGISSEASGSIVSTAATMGVSALRPTYGAVSRHGATSRAWTLDKIVPLARSASDCNNVFHAIMGDDPKDATTLGVFPSGRARWLSSAAHLSNPRRLTIGILKEPRDSPFSESVAALTGLGHTVREIELPGLPYESTISVILGAESASAFEIGGPGATILAVDYLRGQRIRTKIRQALFRLFEEVDLIATPARSQNVIGAAMNLAGAPGIAMPPSIQLHAPPAMETTLLNAAIHYQRVTTHHLERPAASGL